MISPPPSKEKKALDTGSELGFAKIYALDSKALSSSLIPYYHPMLMQILVNMQIISEKK